MRERIPLATVQDAVLEFLRGRDDAAVFGAQAVNAYVDELQNAAKLSRIPKGAVCQLPQLQVEPVKQGTNAKLTNFL